MRFTCRLTTTAAIAATTTMLLAGCASFGGDGGGNSDSSAASDSDSFAASLVKDGSSVIADPDGTGAEVSQKFFSESDTVVVSDGERENQLKAAAIAVELGAPMLIRYSSEKAGAAVDAEIARLGADRVINVGEKAGEETDEEDTKLIADTQPVAAEKDAEIKAIVDQAGGQDSAQDDGAKQEEVPIFATELTSFAAAATAAAGRRGPGRTDAAGSSTRRNCPCPSPGCSRGSRPQTPRAQAPGHPRSVAYQPAPADRAAPAPSAGA